MRSSPWEAAHSVTTQKGSNRCGKTPSGLILIYPPYPVGAKPMREPIPERVSNPVRFFCLILTAINRHKILWRYMCGRLWLICNNFQFATACRGATVIFFLFITSIHFLLSIIRLTSYSPQDIVALHVCGVKE